MKNKNMTDFLLVIENEAKKTEMNIKQKCLKLFTIETFFSIHLLPKNSTSITSGSTCVTNKNKLKSGVYFNGRNISSNGSIHRNANAYKSNFTEVPAYTHMNNMHFRNNSSCRRVKQMDFGSNSLNINRNYGLVRGQSSHLMSSNMRSSPLNGRRSAPVLNPLSNVQYFQITSCLHLFFSYICILRSNISKQWLSCC